MSGTTPTPTIARNSPFPIELEAGKTYYWCSCGLSRKQPFCDGSHKGSGMAPLAYTPEAAGRAWLCGCKHSARAPLCDGRHRTL